MEETKTYWNGNGKHQELYDAQWQELVLINGNAGTVQGEVLRAASRLYHRWFNDGDRIEEHGQISFQCPRPYLYQKWLYYPDTPLRRRLAKMPDQSS